MKITPKPALRDAAVYVEIPERLPPPLEARPPVGSLLHVSADFIDLADPDPTLKPGSEARPFRSLSEAALIARPGDTVRIAPGVYRERVAPARAGEPGRPITFEATAPGVIVRGSEILTTRWTPWPGHDKPLPANQPAPTTSLRHEPAPPELNGHPSKGLDGLANHAANLPHGQPGPAPISTRTVEVFVADLLPALHPDQAKVFLTPAKALAGQKVLGQVFVGGELMLQLSHPRDVERTPGSWCAVEGARIVLRPPVGIRHPSQTEVEVSVRDRLFAPLRRGLGHIHVRGITFEHCANQSAHTFWSPAGHPQSGAVSCRSGHHWVIERCVVRMANSVGIDCGSEGARDLDGDEQTPHIDLVGRHLIRDNLICDCGESGILGWRQIGTRIVNNTVERNNRMGFNAVEEAGIKVHYFIDGLIEGNLVRDNDAHGIWLDNVWYGSRVTRNTVLNNQHSGIMVELGFGPCLVDHNVVAFTRNGEGIYTHDASGVTVAHNLLVANTHFGVHMRTVSDRPTERRLGQWGIGTTRDQRVVGNVFIDNYRGHLCLPLAPTPNAPEKPQADARSVHCDHNVFVNGTMWHWDAQAFHRFAISTSEDRHPRDLILRTLGLDPTPPATDPALTAGQGVSLSLEQWRRLTGHDHSSSTPLASRGPVENGAVVRGSLALWSRALTFEVRDPAVLSVAPLPATDPALAPLTHDFHGQPIDPAHRRPGPFQSIGDGPAVLSIMPVALPQDATTPRWQ